ncbi:MAG: HAD-IIIA family hydrolase [Muribaculaceae bacterium]
MFSFLEATEKKDTFGTVNKIIFTANNLFAYADAFRRLQEDDTSLHQISSFASDLVTTIRNGGKILLCGNGGFAAVSQHIAAELMGKISDKRNPIPCISLCTDTSVLTCIANDFGYEKIFSRQIEGIGRKGDLLIALSSSGKSKNILEALSAARMCGISSWLIAGEGKGTVAEELGAQIIEMPSSETDVVQDVAMSVLHQVCKIAENSVKNIGSGVWEKVLDLADTGRFDTLILDRDGTVNTLLPNEYVLCEKQLCISEEFLKCCKKLSEKFSHIFIVTNQACIGKGIALREQIDSVHRKLVQTLESHGGRIDKIYVCEDTSSQSSDRKPNTGIADKIRKEYKDVDFARAIVVGDSYSDELFAQRIGSTFINIKNA